MNAQRKTTPNQSLLYLDEHRSCQHYISDYNSGFSQRFYRAGKKLDFELKREFVIIFLQSGKMEITSVLNESKTVNSDEICLLNYERDYSCKILQDTTFTLLYFDYPKIKCDKYSLLLLESDAMKVEDDIRILNMVDPLHAFIDNVNLYLRSKMMCSHLHDMKESEWLFIMRGFYTKKQSAYFLAPVVLSLNDFVIKVKDNYLECDSVRKLADKCNMTEKTFTRRFKEFFKDTPKQWMMKEKAKYIRSELDLRELNVKEVANKYGFSSPAHLNNYYKKQFNVTPGKDKNR